MDENQNENQDENKVEDQASEQNEASQEAATDSGQTSDANDEAASSPLTSASVLKALGLLAILCLMVWTWKAFYGSPQPERADEQTLIEIQDNLQDQIYRILVQKNENIKNVKFDKFWTEQLDSGEVVAHFLVSYDEPTSEGDSIRSEREGTIKLEKLGDTPDEQVWSALSVDVEGEIISFENGLKFKAGSESAESEDSMEGEEEVMEIPAQEEAAPLDESNDEAVEVQEANPEESGEEIEEVIEEEEL